MSPGRVKAGLGVDPSGKPGAVERRSHGSSTHTAPTSDPTSTAPPTNAPPTDAPPTDARPDAAIDATELFLRHRELAARAVRRYAGSPHLADLRQVAEVALWLAATRYRPERGVFEHYAAVTVAGEVKRYLRGAGWSLHVSRSRQEDALRLSGVVDDLTHQLGSTPTVHDVAARTGWSVDRVVDAYRCRAARHTVPDGAAPHPHSDLRDLELALVVGGLPETDRLIVRLTYEFEMTQREIGQLLDLTQSTVSRRLRAALECLREMLRTDAPVPGLPLAPTVGVPVTTMGMTA